MIAALVLRPGIDTNVALADAEHGRWRRVDQRVEHRLDDLARAGQPLVLDGGFREILG